LFFALNVLPLCGVVFWSCNVNANWYAIDNAKVYHGFSKVSLKGVQISLQKTITWTKKFRKRRQKWKVFGCDYRFANKDVQNSYEDAFCITNYSV
jgi:hypothetical protein